MSRQPAPLQLTADLAVQPSKIAAVRRSSDSDDGDSDDGGGSCVVYLSGQSAVDGGFLVARPFDEVVEEWRAALDEADGGGAE